MRFSGQNANETETDESWDLFQEEVVKTLKLTQTLSWISQILDPDFSIPKKQIAIS